MSDYSAAARLLLWLGGVVLALALVGGLILFVTGGDDGEPPEAADSASAGDRSTERDGEPVRAGGPVGTEDRPARFGEWYEWDEWRATVLEVVDLEAEGLTGGRVAPPERSMFVAVVYEAMYLGADPVVLARIAVDSDMNRPLAEPVCWNLDLTSLGVDVLALELVPGQTLRLARCMDVDARHRDELDQVKISLSTFADPEDEVVFTAGGEELPPLAPPKIRGRRLPETSPLGTVLEVGDFRAGVVAVTDAESAGLLSPASPPPRPGARYLAVTFEYSQAAGTFDPRNPFLVYGLGSRVFGPLDDCALDDSVLAERGLGVDPLGNLDQAGAVTACLEVPDDELASFVVALRAGFTEDAPAVFYPGAPR